MTDAASSTLRALRDREHVQGVVDALQAYAANNSKPLYPYIGQAIRLLSSVGPLVARCEALEAENALLKQLIAQLRGDAEDHV